MNYVIGVLSMDHTFYLVNRFIRDSRYKTCFPSKIKLSSSQRKIHMLFVNKNRIERRICDKYIHKDMWLPINIYQRNKKLFVTVKSKKAYKLEFSDHLCLPFLVQHQLDILVFAIITFHIHNIIVPNWKHGICHNYIITFNEEL